MQIFNGAKLLLSKLAQPAIKPFEIYDSRLAGFTLRVQPTGVRSYYARLGRSRRIALGKVGTLLPDEARERCQQVLGNVAHGRHPMHGLGGDGLTLGQFIDDLYAVGESQPPPHCRKHARQAPSTLWDVVCRTTLDHYSRANRIVENPARKRRPCRHHRDA
jgi:hypothetical protein